MIRCRISKRELLKKMVAVLRVQTEPTLHFSKEGLKIVETDYSHVIMIYTTIPARDWEVYEVEDRDFAMDVELFTNILRKMDDKDVELKIEKASITINDKIRIKEIEKDKKMLKIPNIEYDFKFNVKKGKFRELIDTSEFITEDIVFVVKDGKVYATCESDNIQMNEFIADVEYLTQIKKGRGLYAIDYLRNMVINGVNWEITVLFGDDKPIKIEYPDEDTCYILAPKIPEG